jgi:gamma-glutamyltranspeptidase / glutathione hydrolase
MPGMIVAPQPEAAEAGADILARGGNAIDAAIAAAFVQGVADPQMCGIGGFGSMHVAMPSRGVHEVLEFYARAPLAARADMWTDQLIGQSRDGFAFLLKGGLSEIGYPAVCTPGNVKGYAEALRRYGSFDWADAIAPAIALARRGVMVRPHMHWFWSQDQSGGGEVNTIDKLRHSRTGREVYFHADGSLKRAGDMLLNKDLGQTLERLAHGGPEFFYHGALAEEIAADFHVNWRVDYAGGSEQLRIVGGAADLGQLSRLPSGDHTAAGQRVADDAVVARSGEFRHRRDGP